MSDTTTHLGLPYLLAAQAQKHVTHNEALRLLDAIVQLSVLDRTRTAPPASPADGDRHLVASGASGLWAGWDLNIAFWVDGAWIRLVPRVGWQVWVADEAVPLVWTGSAWQDVADRPLQVPRIGVNASSDNTNRLSVNSPGVLLNHAGAGIEATVNKAAAGNDASFAFKTGFSARALIGLLGSDDFSFKVSPDGSAFHDAIRIDRNNGRVEMPEPVLLPAVSTAPSPPPTGKLAVYARDRAGQPWLEVSRPSGRDFPLQPHTGVNRIGSWAPVAGGTISQIGMSHSSAGTISHPTLESTNLKTAMRRWTVTSAAAADSVAEQRCGARVCWRGNAAGLGGWSYINRLSLTTLQPTGMGFFGLTASLGAFPATQVLNTLVNMIGIGFQRGTHGNWQLAHNDGSGAPTTVDLGVAFPLNTTDVVTLYISAAPNASAIGVRVVNETSGAVFDASVTTDMPSNTTFLSPRLFLNNGATADVVAYDCAGVYLETDF